MRAQPQAGRHGDVARRRNPALGSGRRRDRRRLITALDHPDERSCAEKDGPRRTEVHRGLVSATGGEARRRLRSVPRTPSPPPKRTGPPGAVPSTPASGSPKRPTPQHLGVRRSVDPATRGSETSFEPDGEREAPHAGERSARDGGLPESSPQSPSAPSIAGLIPEKRNGVSFEVRLDQERTPGRVPGSSRSHGRLEAEARSGAAAPVGEESTEIGAVHISVAVDIRDASSGA